MHILSAIPSACSIAKAVMVLAAHTFDLLDQDASACSALAQTG